MAKGSVITTHLLNGNPDGIRRVLIKNKTCEMYMIPRTQLAEAKINPAINLKQPALYILLESLSSYTDELPKAYIGNAEDVGQRLDQHLLDESKSFFQIALVFVSTDHSINKADVQYLEYQSISAAKTAGRYDMSPNSKNGTNPHLTADQLCVIEEFKEFVWLLTSFAGCKIFIHPISKQPTSEIGAKLFFIHKSGVEASALYGQEEIVVLKGSLVRHETAKSAKPEQRAKALKDLCEEINGQLLVKKDTPFSSPSKAAWFVTGTSINGWNNWMTKEGVTLDQIFRSGDKSQ